MKITRENLNISASILCFWMKTMLLLTFSHPKRYFEKYLHKPELQNSLIDEEWITVKKVVKGTRKISPLFQKNRRCLVESMVVYKTLQRLEIGSIFKIGAKSEEKKISTHAWIEIEGKTVIGGPLQNYNPFIRTH